MDEPAPEDFPTAWQRVLTDPRAFFAELPEAGGLQAPATFLVICAAIRAAGAMLVGLSIGAFFTTLVAQLFWSGVLAAVLVIVAQQVFEGRAGFEAVFRVVAYAAAPTVLAFVPRLGILALLFSWLLMVRGVERMQAFDAPRAVLTVATGVTVVHLVEAALAGYCLGWLG